jgi:hypothetical protein
MNKFIQILNWILLLLGTVLIVLFLMTLGGCKILQPVDNPPPSSDTGKIIWNTVSSMDWLGSLFLLGFVCSIIGAGLGFKKLGITCAASCVAGLFLKSALSTLWFYQAAALIVLASFLIVIAGIIYKNRAIVELIIGAQNLKKEAVTIPVSEVMQAAQSKTTQQLVDQVKSDLKLKGKI